MTSLSVRSVTFLSVIYTGSTDLTVAGADSWGWFGGINPGFTLPVGIKQPEQRELPSTSGGHPGQGGDNASASHQIAPAGFYGGGELSASSVGAPLSVAQPQQLEAFADGGGESDAGASSAGPDAAIAAFAPDGLATTTGEIGPLALAAPVSAGLHINLIADANNVNAPAGWAAAIQQAAAIIEQNFSDPVTINLRYGYASFNNVVDNTLLHGGQFSSGAYANSDAGTTGNYNTVAGWLLADRTTADDVNSYNALPDFSSSFSGGPIISTFRTAS